MAESMVLFDQAFDAAIRLPGMRVDRDVYLRSSFDKHVEAVVLDEAVAHGPGRAGIPVEAIDRAADAAVTLHRSLASAGSTAAGIPGGFAMLGTVPADLTQFFANVVVLSQKLAYLYGWPRMLDDDGELDDETRLVLMMFVGVMMGSEAANQLVYQMAQQVARQAATELPKKALTKYALYNTAKQVAKMLGVKLTKDSFGKGVAKAIPVLGGMVSGGMTWVTFGQGATRLQSHLKSLPLACCE